MEQKTPTNDSSQSVPPKAEFQQSEQEKSSRYNYKDYTRTPEKKRPPIQNRVRKIALTLAACLLMGFVGYKFAYKNQSHHAATFSGPTYTAMATAAIPSEPATATSNSTSTVQPPPSATTHSNNEIAQAVELLDLQRQNQRQMQTIRLLKEQLSNSYQRLDQMKASLEKQKRIVSFRKKEQRQEEELKLQVALTKKQLDEKASSNDELQERIQRLQKQYEEAQTNLKKQEQSNYTLSQRFNMVQKHLQKAQEELLEQTSENERLIASVDALQAELAVTVMQLKEKEQLSEELTQSTKALQEKLTYYTELVNQRDNELAQFNSKVQELYDEQQRLHETLTERDVMTTKLLSKVKKLKSTLEEREREAYARALEQLSSTKRSLNPTPSRHYQETAMDEDLNEYLESRPSVAQQPSQTKKISKENSSDNRNKTRPNKTERETVAVKESSKNNWANLEESKGDAIDYPEEPEVNNPTPEAKAPKSSLKAKNVLPYKKKKSQPVASEEVPPTKSSKNAKPVEEKIDEEIPSQPKKEKGSLSSKQKPSSYQSGRRSSNRVAASKNNDDDEADYVQDEASLNSITRELEREREKIYELEQTLQQTLNRYEETQEQIQTLQGSNQKSGYSSQDPNNYSSNSGIKFGK